MKYIDADKLIAEIESRMEDCKLPDGKFPTKTNIVRYEELSCLRNFIDSLQQNEKAVEIEMCSQAYWEERGWMMIPPDVTLKGIESLLEQVRKKLQQAQPQVADASKMVQPEVDFEKELKNERTKLLDAFGPMNGEQCLAIRNFARHFYELGLNARKEK